MWTCVYIHDTISLCHINTLMLSAGGCSLRLSCCFVLPCFYVVAWGLIHRLARYASSFCALRNIFPPNLPDGVFITYSCSLCKLVHQDSQIGRTQVLILMTFFPCTSSIHEVWHHAFPPLDVQWCTQGFRAATL